MKNTNSSRLALDRNCRQPSLWSIQIYAQAKLVFTEVIEEAEVQPMTICYEKMGYEVRSELAWSMKPSRSY